MKTNNDKKSDKVLAFSTMAAGMAHEIKNPLSSIKVLTQLMSKKFDDPEYREKFIDIMPREISRIDRIIEGLLSYARSHNPSFEPVSVNEVISEAVSHFRETEPVGRTEIILELGELENITADKQQLSQVFVNVMHNAFQAMKDGGRLTIISGKDKEAAKTGWQGIVVTIIDTGPGISAEEKQRIFDPFYSSRYGGTGLGLTIAHGIIEKHNGSIEAESSGAGTTLIIRLPVSQKKVREAKTK